MLEIDEFLSLFTDRQPTVAALLRVQLKSPISLDPPAYHLLSHWMMDWMGPGAIPLRLPALAGFLLFQATLFVFVRRISGSRPGIVAMLLPVLTFSLFYAMQGRPYGLLLGAYGLAMVCWQGGTRATPGRRLGWLFGLAFALVLGVTSHYFGILILVPIVAGEMARTISRRRPDWGVLWAILGGVASVAMVVPFQHAAAEYRVHYYNTRVSWHVIPQSYGVLYFPYRYLPVFDGHLYLAIVALGSAALAAGLILRWRRARSIRHEFIAIGVLGLLPFFGYLLAVLVTHTMDARYTIATLFAVTAALGIVLEPALERGEIFVAATVLLVLYCYRGMGWPTSAEQEMKAAVARQFAFSPEVTKALAANPSQPIYVQSLGDFYHNVYYAPDPALARRFSLVYSQTAELRWLQHDTNYLTARNMRQFTQLSITSYRELLASGDHPLVLNYRDGWDWLSRDLAARHIPMRRIGKMLGGELDQLDLSGASGVESVSSTPAPRPLDRTGSAAVH